MALICSLSLMAGTASARGTSPAASTDPGQCTVKSLPGFTAQGELGTVASVADVIEIGCHPNEYGTFSELSISDPQLYSRCYENMLWVGLYDVSDGPTVYTLVDADGNATVVLEAGPGCQVGETLVSVHELEEPYESFSTGFAVLEPMETPKGVYALTDEKTSSGESSQIEDDVTSSVGTVIEAEFPGASEDPVRLASEELWARCRGEDGPGIIWITPEVLDYIEFNKSVVPNLSASAVSSASSAITSLGEEGLDGVYFDTPEITTTLDNDGNGFAIALGFYSCYPGSSTIEADLLSKPFTTETTQFDILGPKPRDPSTP